MTSYIGYGADHLPGGRGRPVLLGIRNDVLTPD